MKKSLLAICCSSLLFALSSANAGVITIGATPIPHSEILNFIEPMAKEKGVDLKIVEFNDYVQPNLATNDGDLDANFFQHRPYLQTFIDDHGVDLVEVCAVHIEPMGIYSSKLKSLKDLKEGDKIAIPNDATNGGRALLLLAREGIIELDDNENITSTVFDIVKNPNKINIIEIEAAQLPRSLDDVAFAVINTNFAIQANLNPLKDALAIEDENSPYANILVANEASAKKEDLKVIVDLLKDEKTAEFIKTKYKGAILPVK